MHIAPLMLAAVILIVGFLVIGTIERVMKVAVGWIGIGMLSYYFLGHAGLVIVAIGIILEAITRLFIKVGLFVLILSLLTRDGRLRIGRAVYQVTHGKDPE